MMSSSLPCIGNDTCSNFNISVRMRLLRSKNSRIGRPKNSRASQPRAPKTSAPNASKIIVLGAFRSQPAGPVLIGAATVAYSAEAQSTGHRWHHRRRGPQANPCSGAHRATQQAEPLSALLLPAMTLVTRSDHNSYRPPPDDAPRWRKAEIGHRANAPWQTISRDRTRSRLDRVARVGASRHKRSLRDEVIAPTGLTGTGVIKVAASFRITSMTAARVGST
jgi:hypothetical protein